MHIGEIIFFDSTYEVEIKSGKKSAWAFLRLDANGSLLESFCSCSRPCKHVVEAYKAIVKDKPLHLLFDESFFKELGLVFFERWENKPLQDLKEEDWSFKAKNLKLKEKIKELFQPLEAKETYSSLKFAQLSIKELEDYKDGKAKNSLRYKLSHWSDFAKWLFLNQNSLKVSFEGQPLPFKLMISSKDFSLSFQMKTEELLRLIPLLATIKNNSCEVFQGKEISSACFDQEKQVLKVVFQTEQKEMQGEHVGPWIYVAKLGFFKKEENLENEKFFQGEELVYYLNEKADLLKPFFKIEKEAKAIHQMLFVDQDQNLHLESFLKEPFDLKNASFFFPWAFHNNCFLRLQEEPVFKTIAKEKVSEFVSENRLFLQNIEGFSVHFGAFEEKMFFHIDKDQNLCFRKKLLVSKEIKTIDYGAWIYVEGKGFYGKKGLPLASLPRKIIKEEAADFLIKRKKDLEQIPGFFTDENPLEKAGLKIDLNADGKIEITPKMILKNGVKEEDLTFFGPFVFYEKSFFELPAHFRLSEDYRSKKQISSLEESFFVHYELERLKPLVLEIAPQLVRPEKLRLKLTALTKEGRSFVAGLTYGSELGEVSAIDVWQGFLEKKKYLFSPAGLLFLRGYRFKWLAAINPKRILKKSAKIRLKTWEWIKLIVLENMKRPIGKSSKIKKMQKLFDELMEGDNLEKLDLSDLKSTLRPYQTTGVKWLSFLYKEGLSGFLCDEMGLGKTHQAMGLLAHVHRQDTLRKNKYLVVCPTSVIYHWENLLNRFLPEFKVCLFHGAGRTLNLENDLVLTSYGLIRSEKKLFEGLQFEIAIFDEVQTAKNKSSKIHKALQQISAEMYLALTGTPLENRLEELKALFDLMLPGYFPEDSAFKELFVAPIEKENDEKKKKLLNKLVKPFVLRRKKKEVLKDLPEKTEEIAYADLSLDQKQMYQELVSKQKKQLIQELKDETNKEAYLHVFALLTKLKQLCDHPVLIDPKKIAASSGKWDLFQELLEEALASEQKVVVFSQYLGMIKMIENYLKKKNIVFASITGATQKRREEVLKFQEDPKCMVFVGSLLASGVGIDLTAGSVVIHYDRWWNPAKENQATDRVHRIGQNRGVQVFKLTTKDTIEERIHTLIEKKKTLIEEMIGKDETEDLKALSKPELIALLESLGN